MNKYLQIIPVILLFVAIASCNRQKEPDPPKDNPGQTEISVADHDPYFVESKDISSIYGPDSITRNIIQDRKGNLWFATWEGIIRYDGNSFTNFTNKEGLRRFHAFSVLEDKAGNLWFGTMGAGVYRYDGISFTNFTTKDGLANDRIGCLYEDKTGKIWIGTEGGISVYDGSSIRNFTTNEGLTDNDVNSIIEDKTGNIWIGTRGDASFYDGTTFTSIKNNEGRPFTNVRSIIKDTIGNIWLGGNDGLWRTDGGSFTNFTRDFVGYIYEDKKGNIWTSSQAPENRQQWILSRYDENALQDEEATVTSILRREGMFFGILEDRDGGIWLGTLNGVCRYDGIFFNCFKDKGTED